MKRGPISDASMVQIDLAAVREYLDLAQHVGPIEAALLVAKARDLLLDAILRDAEAQP